ncbi:MAG TPA: 30S ribosomal protein S4 [Candidatus Azoamicus sp. OHIO2]
MARYLTSTCKMSRRIGLDLNLKGIAGRNITSKCKLKVFPGQHGSKRKKTGGNYSSQLLAKQTIKYTYGILEKQFFNTYKKTLKVKGSRGEALLKLLESRLDNVVYRMGFAVTRAEARQLVTHKTIIVTRKNTEHIISLPSFLVKPNDIIKIKNKSKTQIRIQHALMCAEKIGFALWLNVDITNMSGTFLRIPERNELSNDFNEQLVVEFYSK